LLVQIELETFWLGSPAFEDELIRREAFERTKISREVEWFGLFDQPAGIS